MIRFVRSRGLRRCETSADTKVSRRVVEESKASGRNVLPVLIEQWKQVRIAEVVHPVPCRTRKLSPPAPMVLRFASRESRTSPASLFFYARNFIPGRCVDSHLGRGFLYGKTDDAHGLVAFVYCVVLYSPFYSTQFFAQTLSNTLHMI